MRYPRFAADSRASSTRFARCASLVPSGSRELGRRSATVVARVLVEFQIDRPFVERLGAMLFGACRRSARPCASAAAVPSTLDLRVVVVGRKGAVERCRETGGAERHAIGEPRVDVRASARSGGGCVVRHVRPRPRHEGVAFGIGSTASSRRVRPTHGTTARSAAGRSDAVRLPVRGILRGVWALRGVTRARSASRRLAGVSCGKVASFLVYQVGGRAAPGRVIGKKRSEPQPAAGCNTPASRVRRKPSRWRKTTRTERDRSDGFRPTEDDVRVVRSRRTR